MNFVCLAYQTGSILHRQGKFLSSTLVMTTSLRVSFCPESCFPPKARGINYQGVIMLWACDLTSWCHFSISCLCLLISAG